MVISSLRILGQSSLFSSHALCTFLVYFVNILSKWPLSDVGTSSTSASTHKRPKTVILKSLASVSMLNSNLWGTTQRAKRGEATVRGGPRMFAMQEMWRFRKRASTRGHCAKDYIGCNRAKSGPQTRASDGMSRFGMAWTALCKPPTYFGLKLEKSKSGTSGILNVSIRL